jgi:hypothetical protein
MNRTRQRPFALVLAVIVVASGCPLFRPSAKPEDACQAAKETVDRCATAPADKWDAARLDACVTTYRAVATKDPDGAGLTTAGLKGCSKLTDCTSALDCVKSALQNADRQVKAAP